jgi:hypothetical protein
MLKSDWIMTNKHRKNDTGKKNEDHRFLKKPSLILNKDKHQIAFEHPLVNVVDEDQVDSCDGASSIEDPLIDLNTEYGITWSDDVSDAKSALIDLSKIALTAELLFSVMFSMEVVVKNVALFGYTGFFLGIFYLIIQTYACCFNYWFDCFYQSQYVTKKQMRVLKPLTLGIGFISTVFLSITVVSNGLVLYNFKFLENFFSNYLPLSYSHGIVSGLIFALIFTAALINFIGSMAHISYNLSKFKVKTDFQNHASGKPDDQRSLNDLTDTKNSKNISGIDVWLEKSKKIFFSATKLRWIMSIINYGFLFSASFNWYGFIVGAFLTALYIYDEAVFLLSCDPVEWDTLQCNFFQLKWGYIFASIFSVGYSAYVVYINLNYFCTQFLPTPYWTNFTFSVFTAMVGVIAGVIRKYKIYEQIKETYLRAWLSTHGIEMAEILLSKKEHKPYTNDRTEGFEMRF